MAVAVIRVDIRDISRRAAALGVNIMPAVQRGLLSAAMRTLAAVQAGTRTAPPANPAGRGSGGAVDTGRLLRSWRVAPIRNGCRLTNSAPYAGVVEFGRRAGSRMPPRAVLVRWAQRRLGLSRRDAQRAAFPIARAIARRGLIGRRILETARPDAARFVREEVQREVTAALAGALGGTT